MTRAIWAALACRSELKAGDQPQMEQDIDGPQLVGRYSHNVAFWTWSRVKVRNRLAVNRLWVRIAELCDDRVDEIPKPTAGSRAHVHAAGKAVRRIGDDGSVRRQRGAGRILRGIDRPTGRGECHLDSSMPAAGIPLS